MKSHGTFTITEQWLVDHGACTYGKDAVASLLPATISTDPDDNYEIAEAFIAAGRAHDIYWLTCEAGVSNPDPDPIAYLDWYGRQDSNIFEMNREGTCENVGLVAQWFAMAADALLSARGK